MTYFRHVSMVTGLVLVAVVGLAQGHGRLVAPPGRSSAWRYGFDTPVYYQDNELFCGGFQHQWGKNGGKCGVCGDPYDGPREHEAGGKYASGVIVASFTSGQVMQVTVQLTANHKGWFEFRLCPNNDVTKAVTQECLDKHLLPIDSDSSTRFPITSDMHFVTLPLRLPVDLTCSQCVLQWKYNTGNSWGVDPDTGMGGMGLGPQEQFYGCADIAIVADDN